MIKMLLETKTIEQLRRSRSAPLGIIKQIAFKINAIKGTAPVDETNEDLATIEHCLK